LKNDSAPGNDPDLAHYQTTEEISLDRQYCGILSVLVDLGLVAWVEQEHFSWGLS